MMKPRNLVILAVVVVALAGISLMQKSSHERDTSQATTTVVVAGEFTRDGLSRISIGHGAEDEVVALALQPDGWVVASAWNAPADEQKIDVLLTSLSDLSGEFRSDSAEVLANYGLSDEAALRIRALDAAGQNALAVDVGKKAEGGRGDFVRRPDESAVYLTQTSILSQLGIYGEATPPKSTHFVALQVVKEDRQDIDRLIVLNGGEALDLVKEFGVFEPAADDTTGAEPAIDRGTWEWKLAGDPGVVLTKTKVDGVLGAAVSLRATDIENPNVDPEVYGLAAPTRSVTLVRADGSELVLEFGSDREAKDGQTAGTWLRIAGRNEVWLATEYTVKGLFKPLSELVPE